MLKFELDPRFSAIAVTGADVGGKSTFMPQARAELEALGLRVAINQEVATKLITAGFHPFEGWLDPFDFQKHVFEDSLAEEERRYRMLKEQNTDKHLVLLCDRGILDGIAYAGRDEFQGMINSQNHDLHYLRERYKAVIHLVTAAEGAEDAYLRARGDNPARVFRTPEEARELDRKTRAAWHGHSHQIIIDNSTDFETKMKRAVRALRRALPMPEAEEQERKFLVGRGNPPKDAVGVEIFQYYLTKTPEGVERRVRRKTDLKSKASTYYYTEKRPTEDPDRRKEKERQITQDEFETLLRLKDEDLHYIRKVRWTYTYASRTFEHDAFLYPIGAHLLEIEGCPMSERIEFAPGYTGMSEVTGNKRFSNWGIAAGLYPFRTAYVEK